jgi:hypothetical protein
MVSAAVFPQARICRPDASRIGSLDGAWSVPLSSECDPTNFHPARPCQGLGGLVRRQAVLALQIANAWQFRQLCGEYGREFDGGASHVIDGERLVHVRTSVE